MLLLTFAPNSVDVVTASLYESSILLCIGYSVGFEFVIKKYFYPDKTDAMKYGLDHPYKSGILKLHLIRGK